MLNANRALLCIFYFYEPLLRSTLCTFGQHTGAVTAVKWGRNASYLASVSADRSLRFYGPLNAASVVLSYEQMNKVNH